MRKQYLLLAFIAMLTSTAAFAKKEKNEATNDKVAYGNVKFGASPAEYNKAVPDSMQKIGNYTYIFRPMFTDGELVQLDIVTPPQDAKEFKEGGAVMLNALVEVLTEKMGTPKHFWTIPAMGAFEVNRKELVADWETGSKKATAYATKDYYQSYWGICSTATTAK